MDIEELQLVPISCLLSCRCSDGACCARSKEASAPECRRFVLDRVSPAGYYVGRRRAKQSALAAIAFLLASAALPRWAHADGVGCAPELVPDRPGATNSYLTVQPMCFQVEISTEFARDSGTTSQSFPTALRLGLFEGFEFRFESNLVAIDYGNESGRGDMNLGAKVLLFDPEEDGAVPGLGFTLVANLPGDAGISDLSPRFDLLADWSFPAGWALSVNAGAQLGVGDSTKRELTIPLSAVLGWNVPGTKDTVGLFVDSGAELAPAPRADTWTQAFGGGIVYFPMPTLQLDLSGSADAIGGGGWWVAAGVTWSMSLVTGPTSNGAVSQHF